MKWDKNTKPGLEHIKNDLVLLLDHVIVYRQSTIYKREYRLVGKRIERSLKEIQDALNIIGE